MTYIFLVLVYGLHFTVFAEKPCEKLRFIGDNIQNKAVLSPIIITGKPGMKIDLSNAQYKLTIKILSVIKGSLGQWNRSILIAGNFSVFNDFKNPCHFQSVSMEKQIYFLQVNSDVNGEYNLLFNPEMSNIKKFAAINATKCADCAKPPTITIKDESTNDFNIIDCVGNGSPPPVVKWTISKSSSKPKIEVIKNGSRVSQSINNSSNEMYTCKAMNALGNASYGIILKTVMVKPPKTISRCSSKDNEQCNGQGKCYEDKTDGNIIFCRCNEGFEGPKCIPIKLPDTLIQPTPKLDSLNCNNKGKAYENWKTKAKTCMCDFSYFGENCEKKVESRTSDKVTISRCSSKDNEQCNGQGKCYEDKTEGNIIFCRCNEGFEGPKCTNVSNKLPDTLIQPIPKLDSTNCNNNGKAFENWKTKEIFCICDFSFFGFSCERKKDVTTKDEVRILQILETSTTKMASKYILIGCLIVLGGCILILVVILCLWKYYFSKNSKKVKDEDDDDDDDDDEEEDEEENQDKETLKNMTSMTTFKNQYLEPSDTLLAKDDLNKIPKNVIPPYHAEINFKGNKSNLFSGNGIYDNN